MLTPLVLHGMLALMPASSVSLPQASDTSFSGTIPTELRERVRDSRRQLEERRAHWERQPTQARRQSLDSLWAVAQKRREETLAKLPADERARVQRRLEELDRRVGPKAKAASGGEFRP